MILKKNTLIFITFTVIIFVLQFIIATKHYYYGFNNDDWYVLAWYNQVVKDPILDIGKAWKEIGSHNFARDYYVGILYNFFGLNYPLYHYFNGILKALAGLSFFPFVYFLFKKKFFAYLTTFLFSLHFSSFATLHDVFMGNESLVIISMNIFLALYVWITRKHNYNLKMMLILLILLLLASFFDIPRFYPVLFLLPFFELLNFWLNRSSTTFKSAVLRLIFLYLPFIAVILYSPQAVTSELNINKLIRIVNEGNYQLYISLFASFGSTFIPQGLLDQLSLYSRLGVPLYQDFRIFLNFVLFKFLVIALPALYILGLLVLHKPKWFILRSIFLNICFSILAFLAANNWIYLDSKVKAAVDPGTYFIPGMIGLFVLSTAISFFIEWLKNRDNYLVLTLSLAPIFSLLYTFFTWILAGDNVIFMGVHGYLTIAALASSLYLAIIFYLAFQNLKFRLGITRGIAAIIMTAYFFMFLIFSAIQVDNYYADWLKNGYAASDQNRIQTSFWKEVGRGKSKDQSPILVYLDTSADDGYYYGSSFVWDIHPLLAVEKDLPFVPGGHCLSMIKHIDLDKLRMEEVGDQKMIVQTTCGERFYKLENFYAFKFIDRELVPIKSEIIKQVRGR